MPDADTFSRGYSLYYQLSQPGFTRKRIIRDFCRAYRRGGYFAEKHLQQLIPRKSLDILEVGAGNGYFAQGIKRVFQNSRITYIDIVKDLAKYYKDHFDCNTIISEFRAAFFPEKKFDLIIARDLLEHLRDPYQFLQDANFVLKDGGYIYFITPNGRENLWLCNQLLIHEGREYLVIINHVHYFLPEVLDRLLSNTGFEKKIYFKWGLKGHKQGIGHREFIDFPQQELPVLKENVPVQLISVLWKHKQREVTGSLLHGLGKISRIYSSYRDRPKGRTDFYDYKGHEFFVVAQKVKSL
jgi:2-polyprenyl-3-methyl-5-hydroxy-6-metoxy-1,4-benzoquinol methylase